MNEKSLAELIARVEQKARFHARLQCLQAAAEIRHRHDAAVGRHRVGAEHQEEPVRRHAEPGDEDEW